jgi:hypothetical protein
MSSAKNSTTAATNAAPAPANATVATRDQVS